MSKKKRKKGLPAGNRPNLGVECPGCGCKHLATIETRKVLHKIRRRRECRYCGKRFTTYEAI